MKDENYEEMRKQICAECGDVLPFPCSDSYACIMADEIKDRSSNGAYGEHASLVKAYDAEIARLRAEVEAAKGMTVHILADNERLCELVKDLQPKVCGIDQSPCHNAPCDNCVPNLTAQLEQAKELIRFPPSSLLDDGGWLERCNKFIRDTNND